jgi:NAD(P)-dependent dehydrogenase (short-subunit alcohol dehydrogenase family)
MAKRLADDGWRVLVHGRDRGRGEARVADIKAAGGTAEFLQADLSSIAEVRRLADAVQKTTRRLDLLINNAGLGSGVSRTARKRPASTGMSFFSPSTISPAFCSPICFCRSSRRARRPASSTCLRSANRRSRSTM